MKAPAKLNLHLQVGGRRADGFHDIKSLFVMVDLFDQIRISSLKTGNQCEIDGEFDCATEDNLIYKAWKLFCEETGRSAGVLFEIEKSIPVKAGMGGGSSDAAAVLAGLNRLCNTGLSGKRLCELGAAIGSDVPFFLNGPAAIVEGRGDEIVVLEKARELYFIIVNPEISISTVEAYGWIDEDVERETIFLDTRKITNIYDSDIVDFKGFQNDFTSVICRKHPCFKQIIEDLYNCGAVYGNVTGSGSVVFGLYKDGESAEKAYLFLKNRYKFVLKIKSLDRIPYAILK